MSRRTLNDQSACSPDSTSCDLFELPLGVILAAAPSRPTLNRLARWNLHHREGTGLGMGSGGSALGLLILTTV